MDESVVAAYSAGLFDGEGCISISAAIKRNYSSPVYSFRIKVGMTDESTIRWLNEHWGGKFHRVDEKRLNKDGTFRRPIYQWYLCGKSSLGFLRACLPYFNAKKRQAVLAIEWLEKYCNHRRCTLEEHLARKAIFEEIRSLNLKKGKCTYQIPVNSVKPETGRLRLPAVGNTEPSGRN